MITRANIQLVIGTMHGPSEVATILDCIRRDDSGGLATAASLAGTSVHVGLGLRFVADCPQTLIRTLWGRWHVVPLAVARRVETLGALAILEALSRRPVLHGMDLNRLHVSATAKHQSPADTTHLLEEMVRAGEIESAGQWLFQLTPGMVVAAA